jgi:hypothetical protein
VVIDEVPLDDVKVGVWCATNETRVLGLVFSPRIINSQQNVPHILVPSVHLSDYKRTCALSQQDSATAHTTNSSVYCFESFWWQNNKRGFWPSHLPDRKLCIFYTWLRIKCIVIVLVLKVLSKKAFRM